MDHNIFPIPINSTPSHSENKKVVNQSQSVVLQFGRRSQGVLLNNTDGIRAHLSFEGDGLTSGSQIKINISGTDYDAILLDILERDANGNVKSISYTVPYLSGDDPSKFGTATFRYSYNSN